MWNKIACDVVADILFCAMFAVWFWISCGFWIFVKLYRSNISQSGKLIIHALCAWMLATAFLVAAWAVY